MLQTLASWFRRKILRDRRAKWNRQYTDGRWETLKNPEENARFAAVVGFLRQHAGGGRVLEIGCGEALLQRRMLPSDYSGWVGIDVSDIAISRAQAQAGEHVRYVTADMERYQPDGRFDAIVFTESIYYVPRCDRLLDRYATFLNVGGSFVVSIFSDRRSPEVWRQIHTRADMMDTRTTTNDRGTWVCEILRPRTAGLYH